MYINRQFAIITVFITFICFLKGQQTKTRPQPKLNRYFANISRECLRENHVYPERVVALYSLNTNDQDAKCYVACMMMRFNVTNGKGEYDDEALKKLIMKPSVTEIPARTRSAIEKCEKEGEGEKNRCEKAVNFTKCIYAHKNEIKNQNKTSSEYRRRPTMPFGRGRPFGGRYYRST
ncbi:Hypothetical protein CINCED_3A018580 [Cinara cedri]|uniref:Pheromone/general odorant binding protein n=1 Tax=Cinara cedri TaxID=506608 RepID=A0A5E4MZ66_9HEMI|nr:Hypothetical protein CINCED_3A018580 [Cinara cedri]